LEEKHNDVVGLYVGKTWTTDDAIIPKQAGFAFDITSTSHRVPGFS